jgi:hypothetical protein
VVDLRRRNAEPRRRRSPISCRNVVASTGIPVAALLLLARRSSRRAAAPRRTCATRDVRKPWALTCSTIAAASPRRYRSTTVASIELRGTHALAHPRCPPSIVRHDLAHHREAETSRPNDSIAPIRSIRPAGSPWSAGPRRRQALVRNRHALVGRHPCLAGGDRGGRHVEHQRRSVRPHGGTERLVPRRGSAQAQGARTSRPSATTNAMSTADPAASSA